MNTKAVFSISFVSVCVPVMAFRRTSISLTETVI